MYADTDDVSGVLALAYNYLIINEVYLMNNNIINKNIFQCTRGVRPQLRGGAWQDDGAGQPRGIRAQVLQRQLREPRPPVSGLEYSFISDRNCVD